MPGISYTALISFGNIDYIGQKLVKNCVTIKLASINDKLSSSFKCEIIINKNNKIITTSKNQLDMKQWKATLYVNEGISFHGHDKNKTITHFKKDDIVVISCNNAKVNDSKDGTINSITLLKDSGTLAVFKLNGLYHLFLNYLKLLS